MNKCLPEQLLPDNFFTNTRAAVTRTAFYLVTLLPVHTLFLHVHHAFFFINIAQSKWEFYSTLTPGVDGRAGNFFKSVRIHTRCDSPEIVYALADFLRQLLCGIPMLNFGRFIALSLPALTFSLTFKGFNIGQKNSLKKVVVVQLWSFIFVWNIFKNVLFQFNPLYVYA